MSGVIVIPNWRVFLLLLQALVPLLAEDEPDTLLACWEALGAVTASIPKEMQPSFVRCTKVGFHVIRGLHGCMSALPTVCRCLLTCSSSHPQASLPCYGASHAPWQAVLQAVCTFALTLSALCLLLKLTWLVPLPAGHRTRWPPRVTRSGASGAWASPCWCQACACPRRCSRCCPSTCRACCRCALCRLGFGCGVRLRPNGVQACCRALAHL